MISAAPAPLSSAQPPTAGDRAYVAKAYSQHSSAASASQHRPQTPAFGGTARGRAGGGGGGEGGGHDGDAHPRSVGEVKSDFSDSCVEGYGSGNGAADEHHSMWFDGGSRGNGQANALAGSGTVIYR